MSLNITSIAYKFSLTSLLCICACTTQVPNTNATFSHQQNDRSSRFESLLAATFTEERGDQLDALVHYQRLFKEQPSTWLANQQFIAAYNTHNAQVMRNAAQYLVTQESSAAHRLHVTTADVHNRLFISALDRMQRLLSEGKTTDFTYVVQHILRANAPPAAFVPWMTRVAEAYPNHIDVDVALALLLMNSQQQSKALALLSTMATHPDITPHLLAVASHLWQFAGQPEAAIIAYQQVITRQPTEVQYPLQLAQLLSESGDYAQAEPMYHAVLAQEPYHHQALCELAWTQKALAQHHASQQTFRRLRELINARDLPCEQP